MDKDWDILMKEHEQLLVDRVQARINQNFLRLNEIEVRLNEIDDLAWRRQSAGFPELLKYSSIFDALQNTSNNLGIIFPNINYSKSYKFMFSVSNDARSILIALNVSESKYVISLGLEVQSKNFRYGGFTKSLEEVAIILNHWYVKNVSIDVLSKEFQFISNIPRISEF